MNRLLFALLFVASPVLADPFAVAVNGSTRVTLYTEPCALTEYVTNLPKRIVWEDGKQKIEGCGGMIGPIIVAYFADKTVAAIPVEDFVRVTGL